MYKYVKLKCPKTTIISGGPNIDDEIQSRINFLKENNYIDYYLTDGGEEPLSELINWLAVAKKKDTPKNIIFLKNSIFHIYLVLETMKKTFIRNSILQ